MEFGTINSEILTELAKIVGEKNLFIQKEDMVSYSHDEFSLEEIGHLPDVVIKPETTEQVSAILKLANLRTLPVTPRGGGTGLCGGCVPVYGGIVLSLEKMNKVLEIDTKNLMAVTQAGVSLHDFYQAVNDSGLFFPPHPGDEGAEIGGVISTNAGGARAVKFGVIRNFVHGLEVVLPDGEIVHLGGKLIKSSTGYSLLHLMIGSEGTLGIITKATLSLVPPPAVSYTLIIPFSSLAKAIATVPEILCHKIIPMAVEFLENKTILITEALLNKTWPCHQGEAYLMLIVDGSNEEEAMRLCEQVQEAALKKEALDVFIASEKSKQEIILDIRSHIYEAMRSHMLEILDITVPRASIADFVNNVHEIEKKYKIWLPTYGHAADGNVHTHIMKANFENGVWKETDNWKEKYPLVRNALHEIGKKYSGLVSGEHGIGLVKKEYMATFLEKRQIELMREIKYTFDPKGILNPGKIFPEKKEI